MRSIVIKKIFSLTSSWPKCFLILELFSTYNFFLSLCKYPFTSFFLPLLLSKKPLSKSFFSYKNQFLKVSLSKKFQKSLLRKKSQKSLSRRFSQESFQNPPKISFKNLKESAAFS